MEYSYIFMLKILRHLFVNKLCYFLSDKNMQKGPDALMKL